MVYSPPDDNLPIQVLTRQRTAGNRTRDLLITDLKSYALATPVPSQTVKTYKLKTFSSDICDASDHLPEQK